MGRMIRNIKTLSSETVHLGIKLSYIETYTYSVYHLNDRM